MTPKTYNDLIHVLAEINPFLMGNENGRLITYRDAKECYQLVLFALWSHFPLGFVDVAFFMLRHQGLSALRICNILKGREYCFLKWDKHDPERNDKLRQILRLLLQESGCPLNEKLFYDAVENLDNFLKNSRIDVKKTCINNLNVIE